MPTVNSQYSDRLFNFIFGSESNKKWTLNLYNAINGTAYQDPELIQINTIKEVLYMGMHNDVSFLLLEEMNLYEQQSTYNPNMPVRLLQYLGSLYEKYITERDLNKYGSTLIALPVPKLVVFYNGAREQADETIVRLSDAFPEEAKSDVEVTVKMININHGRNEELMDACQPLKEYSWLMNRIRENIKENKKTGVDEDLIVINAVDKAVEEMPKESLLKPFLDAHKAEVKGMLLTEYNEAEAMRLFELDGERRGEEAALLRSIKNIMEGLKYSPEQAMDLLKIPPTDQAKYAAML